MNTVWRPITELITLLTLVLLGLVGCVSQTSVPEDHYYRLPEIKPEKTLSQPILNGAIGIAQLRAEGLYLERTLLYIDPTQPLEVRRYHYRHWIKVPTQLLHDSMLAYMRDVAKRRPRH